MSVYAVKREQKIEFLSQMIREGSDYEWQSDIERKIWTEVADDILRDHLRGKKTIVSESCFRAYVEKNNMLLAESAARLNEGFLDGLKDLVGGGLAKTFGKVFGGTKSRNWWIFGGGGDKENQKYLQAYKDATEENQEVFAKLGDKTLKNLIDQVKEALPDWPNGGGVKEFTDVMSKFVQYYESIRTAAGAKTTDGQEPPKGDAPKLSVEDANKIIEKMRKAMQYFDRELKDRYTYNLESRTRRMPTLVEALLLEAEEDDNIGAEGRKTSSMKGLESNLAPAILAGLGLTGIAAGLLVQSDWFIKLTSVIKDAPSKEVVQQTTEYMDKTLGTIKPEQGWEWTMNNLTPGGPQVTYKSDMTDVIKKITLAGGGDYAKGVEAYTAGPNPYLDGGKQMADVLMKLKSDPHAYGKTFADFQSFAGTGTGKKVGDLCSVQLGRQLKGKVATNVTKVITVGGGKVMTQTALGAKLTALGPWGVGIGAGLIASAAAIKSLRDYGAKNSRTTYFQAAVDQFKDIKPDEVAQIPEDTTPPEVTPAETGKVIVVIDKDQVAVSVEKAVIESGGFMIKPSFTTDDVPIGDEEKAKEAVIAYAKAMNGKAFDFAKGMTADKFAELKFDITDKRQKAKGKITDPGRGELGVVAIKDSYIPSLTSILFESADLRVVDSPDTKKEKSYKELKKSLKQKKEKLPLPDDFSTKEDDAMNKISPDEKSYRQTSSPKDSDIQKGLNALRKKAKSGNLILTFDNSTHVKLKDTYKLSDEQIKKLLAIYSKDPSKAPKIDDYKKVYNSKNVSDKKGLRNFLIKMGIAIGKETAENAPNQEPEQKAAPGQETTAKGPQNSGYQRSSADSVILERWQKMAGLLN